MKAGIDIGDFVYIIITLVFLIAGAIGKKKKPVKQISQNVLPDQENIPVSNENQSFKIEDLFKEYMLTEEKYIPEENIEESYVAEEVIETPPPESPAEEFNVPEENLMEPVLNNEYSGTEVTDFNRKYESTEYQNFQEGKIIFSDEIKQSEGKELISDESTPELEEIIRNFNAREGIIYSEILNRKDF